MKSEKRRKRLAEKRQRKEAGYKGSKGTSRYASKCGLYGAGKSMIRRRTITLDTGKQVSVPVNYDK